MKSFRPSQIADGDGPSPRRRILPGAARRRDDAAPKPKPPSAEDLLELADKVHGARAKRRAFPDGDALSEPAWEMLLALYRADSAMHRVTISNLCLASEAPLTTALRWIERLRELGLVRRRPNPLDSRVVFIELEPSASQAVNKYLFDIWLTLRGLE